MRLRVFVLHCASVTLLAGCVGQPVAPKCTPVSSSQAAASGDTTATTTGLRYIEGKPGSGVSAEWCRAIAIDYTAYLLDGTKFDSSRDTGQQLVFTPGFGGLIDGLEEGVIGMRAGGTRRLIIPPQLGFGSDARRNLAGDIIVPANSTVVFDVEVVQTSQ